MNFSADFFKRTYPFLLVFSLPIIFLLWHFAPRAKSAETPEKPAAITNYDIRTDQTAAARTSVEKFIDDAGKTAALISGDRKQMIRARQNLRLNSVRVKTEDNEELQIPEVIAPADPLNSRFLSPPASANRAGILRAFLKQNSALFGLQYSQIDDLKTTADYTNPDGNLAFVHFAQTINGVPVFRGEVKAGFTKKGEIVRVINNLAPLLDYQTLSVDFGSAETAVTNAAANIGLQANDIDLKRAEPAANELKVTFERGQFADRTTAEKIYFPVEAGVARTAWRVLLWTNRDAYYVIVDAQSGTLLWRKDITQHQTLPATYNVYGNAASMMKAADSPTPFTPGCTVPSPCPEPPIIGRQNFSLIGNEAPYNFNNLGWINDGENRTIGNNAEAGIDRDGTDGIDPNGYAYGTPNRNFVFNYNPAPGNPPPGDNPIPPDPQPYPPSPFQQGSITNAFYVANRFHDEMYRLGFTEAAGNFQNDNFGRGGTGGDSVSVQVQNVLANGVASFVTPTDGQRPKLELNTVNRDTALDNQVIVHELTHGLSNRLHGDGTGLTTSMSGAMGEGWSDFYAFALLSEPDDNLLGTYTAGAYGMNPIVLSNFSYYYYGIRRFPTAVKQFTGPNGLPHDPFTGNYYNNCSILIGSPPNHPNSAFEASNYIGGTGSCTEVHNAGEIWATALWEVRGRYIARLGWAEGNRRVLQFITDGMKLAPLNPTFLQERDAILAAAQASGTGPDVFDIWEGFALRGMGFSAQTDGVSFFEAFDTPNVVQTPNFTYTDNIPGGNNNGYPEPGETLRLTIPLTNNSGLTVTGVTLQIAGGGSASYGDIANGQTVSRNINFTIPAGVPCPGSFTLTFNISSSIGTRSETRTLALGFPAGGPPVTFTNATPLSIPVFGASTPYGTTINVTGVTGNKKIRLELTGLTHTFPGDLDILLVGPGGQKFIVMSDVGNNSDVFNINLTLSDGATNPLPSTALTTGEYRPTDQTPSDTFPAPAPAPPYSSPAPSGTATFASVFGNSGAALNGTWTLYVVDDAGSDSGSLAGWKLTIESNDYICCFCPFARKSVVSSPMKDNLAPVCTCALPIKSRADFDGDGRTDLSVFRPSEGNWYLNRSTMGFTAANWGLGTDIATPEDFDGDGKADVAVWRPASGTWYVLQSATNTAAIFNFGSSGDIPVQGNYDGDNKADFAVFRPSTNVWYIQKSGGGTTITAFGASGDVPVRGDFDGDGKADIAVFRPSTGQWWIAKSNGGISVTTFGLAGDKLVPADYDGDSKDDIAVYRGGTWYILKSTSGAVEIVNFGLADDVPVPGDYDGDQKDDQAIYRNGTWWLNRSTAGVVSAPFGVSDDLPLPSRYLP
jgi:subtilisin-like proprotein convertase family protein